MIDHPTEIQYEQGTQGSPTASLANDPGSEPRS